MKELNLSSERRQWRKGKKITLFGLLQVGGEIERRNSSTIIKKEFLGRGKEIAHSEGAVNSEEGTSVFREKPSERRGKKGTNIIPQAACPKNIGLGGKRVSYRGGEKKRSAKRKWRSRAI